MRKSLFLVLIVSSVLLLGVLVYAASRPGLPADRPHYAHSTLTITRHDGTVFSFDVEVAATPQEQAYGLMFVPGIDEDKGMIFPYNPPQETAFWMKNTLIPLDMLFVRADNTIGHLVAEARPHDITPIPSQGAVIAVIEIAGGLAKKDGLAEGDKVDCPCLRR